MDHEEARARYAELVATISEAELRGAKMLYTSMNGNMYSYLGENGVGLRLPADVREEFLKRYRTTLYQTHGTVQKEYTLASRAPGASLGDIMARMGHDSPRAALIYQHANRAADQGIADAIDMAVKAARRKPSSTSRSRVAQGRWLALHRNRSRCRMRPCRC